VNIIKALVSLQINKLLYTMKTKLQLAHPLMYSYICKQ